MCGRKSGRFSRPTARGRAKALVALSLVLFLGLSPLMAWPQPSKPSKEQTVQVQESQPQEVRLSPVAEQKAPSQPTVDTMKQETLLENKISGSYSEESPLSTSSSDAQKDVAALNELRYVIESLQYNAKLKDAMFDSLKGDALALQAEYDTLAEDYAKEVNAPKPKAHKTTIMPKAAYRINDGAWGVALDLTHRIGYVSLGVGATYFPTDGLDKTIVTGGVGVSF